MERKRVKWTFTGEEGLPAYRGDQAATIRSLTVEDMSVVFQPIVDLQTGDLLAHEALARCKVERFKNPVVLFEQAMLERATGRLGRLVREVAFTQCRGMPVFVNLHPDELSSRWLVRPDDPLCFHDFPVYLEITESAAFTHYELCQSVLKEVCERTGAYLVVDDFGAGHSNMKRMLDLRPHIVKLDRALVTDLDRNERQRRLVEHVVQLCVELGSKVVAEGVETIAELEAVKSCGVHYVQGYFIAKPALPPPESTWKPGRASKRPPASGEAPKPAVLPRAMGKKPPPAPSSRKK